MATKKELERKVKKQQKEISRQNKIIEKYKTQFALMGIRACRARTRIAF